MRKIDQFVNLYSVSKTLRFKAIPIGKTQENIEAKRLIEEDEERAEHYKKAKKLIDRYHIEFIDRVLNYVELKDLHEYVALFRKKNKDEADKKRQIEFEANLRKQIAKRFTEDPMFNKIFAKDMLKEVMPQFLVDQEEKEIINNFANFWTAFSGYNENRKIMYSEEEKSSAIAYRCINDNLPRFISNQICFELIREVLDAKVMTEIAEEMALDPYAVQDFFGTDFFGYILSNTGINTYNNVLGGYVTNDGKKVKGLNEYINLYNQNLSKTEKNKKLPLLKPLYKQVLAERESISFYSDGYQNVKELLEDLRKVVGEKSQIWDAIHRIKDIFSEINQFNPAGIFIKNGPGITDLSNEIAGSWSVFQNNWNLEYDKEHMKKIPKNMEQYEDKRRKYYNSIDSFSIFDFSRLLKTQEKTYSSEEVMNYYHQTLTDLTDCVDKKSNDIEYLLLGDLKDIKLKAEDVSRIKDYLDAIKEIEKILKPIQGSGKEADRDEVFYGEYTKAWDDLITVDALYDKVRNYFTKKPFSNEKFKLYFQNPEFLAGWDINKERSYRTNILRKNGMFYLAVIDKADSSVLQKDKYSGELSNYEKMIYKQMPDVPKYLSMKQILPQNPPDRVKKILMDKKLNPGQISDDDKNYFIKYLADDFLKNYQMILDQNGKNYFDFKFKNPKDYKDINDFYADVESQAYSIRFEAISEKYIDELVEAGAIYLFRLYNKDFSEHSHGTENLHTMYFRQLFNGDNHGSVKLCGGAELFFRKASIKQEDRIIHPANQSIKNKNPLNVKKESIFEYDLIKDKRYTVDQYEIHIPISLNRNSIGMRRLNDEVRKALKKDENPYVIGIDRGERNLLYVCVIDGEGRIVEQYSLNEIVNKEITTDYQDLLTRKEKERDRARKDWKTIENIKELKEGYISQVIRKISDLVIKYDAIIAMEDLNSGFKNGRKKVERQVYQKFEKALIDKFNYLTDKAIVIGKKGSITQGYQLANKFESFKKMGTQNGFIFYIPAWLTSKVDPVTGFADLLKPKYTNMADAKGFIRSFDGIRYNKTEDMFAFDIDYRKFPKTDADYRKKWQIYTNGTRIRTFSNPKKNNEWDYEEIELTAAFKTLFEKYNVLYKGGDLREAICCVDEGKFYEEFMRLLRLTLQMRNSIPGRTDVDYLVSPVHNCEGKFYDSRNCSNDFPQNADANGAYNIARKALWAVQQFKNADEKDLSKTKIAISNKEWLEFVQTR